MTRRPILFRQVDVSRALKAAIAAGMPVDRVEIDPATGKIIIVAGGAERSMPETDFDRWKAGRDARPS